MLIQQCFVSILLVTFPRYRDSGASPQNSAKSTTQRGDVRKTSVLTLHISHRPEISSQKLRDICQIGSSSGKDGNIPCPTQTFIPLRTIRRDRHEIGIRRPCNILPKFVYFRIGCLIMRRKLMNGTKYYTFHRIHRQCLFNTGNFYKAITVIGEPGKDCFFTTFRYINILCHSCTDILKHYHADITFILRKIGIFHFRKTQIYLRSGLHSGQVDFWHTCHILSHIINKYTRTDFFHRQSSQFFYSLHRLTELPDKFKIRVIIHFRFIRISFRTNMTLQSNFAGRMPTGRIIGGGTPSLYFHLSRSIVYFPLKEAAIKHRPSVETLPSGRVGNNHFFLSVRISDN